MPILVLCPSCAGQLRIPDELIGRQARCPACQTIFDAVAPRDAEVEPAPPRAPRPGPPRSEADDLPIETVQIDPWGQVDLAFAGPPPDATPEQPPVPEPPSRPSRLVGAVEVEAGPQDAPRRPSQPAPSDSQRDDRRRCPECGETVEAGARRCPSCGEPIGAAPPGRGGPPYRESFALEGPVARRDCEPHRGNTVMVMGILSLTCLAFFFIPFVPALIGVVLGAVAWWMGMGDLRRMKDDAMDPAGRGSTMAGWICGLIGALLNGVWLLTCGGCIGSQFYFAQQQSQQTVRPPFQAPLKKGEQKKGEPKKVEEKKPPPKGEMDF